MSPQTSLKATHNRILAALSAEDAGLLQPHLVPVSLQLRQVLEAPNLPIEHAYFIEQGLASIIAIGRKNRRLEVGLIGRDGMTGIAISLAATVRQTRLSSKLPEAGFVPRVMICRLPCMIRKSGNRFSERIMRQKRA
jgi:hypothetical protein